MMLRRVIQFALAAAVLSSFGGFALADSPEIAERREELLLSQGKSLAKTQKILDDKLSAQKERSKARVRSIYKLQRASWPRVWFEPEVRGDVVRWLAAARRLRKRDRREEKILEEEVFLAQQAQHRLEGHAKEKVPTAPEVESLSRPVPGDIVASYGEYPGPWKRLRLRRRGVEFKSRKGQKVQAPKEGNLRYSGIISGLGASVILESEGQTFVLGGVQSALPVGSSIQGGDVLGTASGKRVYFEMRLISGEGGIAIDPSPFLTPNKK